MVNRVTQPSHNRPIVNDSGILSNEFNVWVQTITNRTLIITTGSPEGAVEAIEGAVCMDKIGTAGNILYIKRDNDDGLGDKTKGWILV
jgi:hypothetical protein